MLDCFGKFRNRFVGIAMFNPFPDTMIQVSFQNNLSNLMQCSFCRIDLNQYILARDIIVYHFINGLELPDDFIKSSVKIIRIHTLTHDSTPFHTHRGMSQG